MSTIRVYMSCEEDVSVGGVHRGVVDRDELPSRITFLLVPYRNKYSQGSNQLAPLSTGKRNLGNSINNVK